MKKKRFFLALPELLKRKTDKRTMQGSDYV